MGADPPIRNAQAPHRKEGKGKRQWDSPRNGDSRLLLGAHGDAALQVVELAKVLPQRAAALEVPGHVDGALQGREEEEEAVPGTGPRSRVTYQAGTGARLVYGEICREEGMARAGHWPAPPRDEAVLQEGARPYGNV